MLSRLMTFREQVIVGGAAVAVITGSCAMLWYNTRGPGAAPKPEWTNQALPPPISITDAPVLAADTAPLPTVDSPAVQPVQIKPPQPEISVAVRGAVLQEGVYELPSTSRVHHAIEAAGGTSASADLSDINLSARLIDATTLIIPLDPYQTASARPSRLGASPSPQLNPPSYTLSGGNAVAQPARAAASSPAATTPSSSSSNATSSGGLINLNTASATELETLPGIGPRLAERIMAYREQGPFRRIEDLMEVGGIAQGRFDAVRDLITVQ